MWCRRQSKGEQRMPRRQGRDSSDERTDFARALGRTVKVLRTELGIDRRRLAQEAGISYSYLTEIENGNKPASSSVLARLAPPLGVRLHQLIEGAEARMEADARMETDSMGAGPSPALSPPGMEARLDETAFLYSPQDLSYMPSRRGAALRRENTLLELQRLLPRLPPQDLERVLDMVRRLLE